VNGDPAGRPINKTLSGGSGIVATATLSSPLLASAASLESGRAGERRKPGQLGPSQLRRRGGPKEHAKVPAINEQRPSCPTEQRGGGGEHLRGRNAAAAHPLNHL
jgi:hypothetical protein